MSYINVRKPALRSALVSNFLLAELLTSRSSSAHTLWLISPWMTDFVLNLPIGGDLSALVDTAEPQPRLFEVLHQIARNGGQIAITVRAEWQPPRIERFIAPLKRLAAEQNISVRQHYDLHAKIYAGQCGALYGSLNLTESGVEHNVEFGMYASDTRTIARLRAEARFLFESAEELAQ